MNQSETPRTDEAQWQPNYYHTSSKPDVVHADFARTLERELAAAQKELADVRRVAGELAKTVAENGHGKTEAEIWPDCPGCQALAAWEKLNQKQ